MHIWNHDDVKHNGIGNRYRRETESAVKWLRLLSICQLLQLTTQHWEETLLHLSLSLIQTKRLWNLFVDSFELLPTFLAIKTLKWRPKTTNHGSTSSAACSPLAPRFPTRNTSITPSPSSTKVLRFPTTFPRLIRSKLEPPPPQPVAPPFPFVRLRSSPITTRRPRFRSPCRCIRGSAASATAASTARRRRGVRPRAGGRRLFPGRSRSSIPAAARWLTALISLERWTTTPTTARVPLRRRLRRRRLRIRLQCRGAEPELANGR